jgi:CRP/FNR family transcriptional regulator, cyclic AMP receptor protein
MYVGDGALMYYNQVGYNVPQAFRRVKVMEYTVMLKNIPLFSFLDDDELNQLEEISKKKGFPKNTVIMSEGDMTDSLYVVLKGRAYAVSSDENGKQIVLNVFEVNDYFGEMSFIDGESRCATIITKVASQFLVISAEGFNKIVSTNPQMMVRLIKGLLQKLRRATRQIEELAFKDVYGRIARFLSESADEKGLLSQKITHLELAHMVGASREMVSRILKALTDGGYIVKQKGRLRVAKSLPFKF